MEIKVNALMLRAADYGENDKILTLLTVEQGKLSAGIKGVKKAGAKLKFAAQPFCFAEYVLVGRGQKYTVKGCTEIESFYDLRTDINKFYAASAAAEAALALAFEGDESRRLFYGLVDAYSAMCTGDESLALVNFLTFALAQSGYAISAGACPHCGKNLVGQTALRFDMSLGAFTCADCCDGPGASRVTYNVLRKVFGLPCEEDFITPDGVKRALRLLREFYVFKTDNHFKALEEYIRLLPPSGL